MDMNLSRDLNVSNARGLHARSATRIIQIIQGYDVQVTFSKDGRSAGGDSILSLLTLDCPQGSVLSAHAEGPDAEACLNELQAFFARHFDEEQGV